MWKSTNFTIVLLFYASFSCSAQSQSDFDFLNEVLQPQAKEKITQQYAENLSNNGSEIQLLATGIFYVYKEFFSSQDFNRCVFHPSCSVYGIESIKKHGMLKGGIKTFDRLMRCNAFSPEKYEIDLEQKQLLDPID